ncbi:hypothetical protein MNV49_006341 [Pseudohyphozyma bogoriensis]|nr:hypothetical protein MNV49_006341 [Pseudohyphozyma bogoriensis]
MAPSFNLDEEVRLFTTNASREAYDELATLYSLIVCLDYLERAYAPACSRLLAQYKTIMKLVGESVPSVEAFMAEYRMDCTAALHRLNVGVPATVEHSSEDGPGGMAAGETAKWVAETTQNFITFMDALKLKLRAKDQLHPLLTELMSGYTRFKASEQWEGRPKILHWLITLNQMRASEEVSEDQARQFKILPPSSIPSSIPATHAVEFTSLTMTPKIYLKNLLREFEERGGQWHRVHLHHVNQAVTFLPGVTPSKIIVCLGLGAATLNGVLDPEVFPTQGQVLVLDAPWIKEGFTLQRGSLATGGRANFVIPRSNGEVIIGGTRAPHSWNVHPSPAITDRILSQMATYNPYIFQPSTPPHERTVDTLKKLIKRTVTGYRPTRVGGPRIERIEDVSVEVEGVKKEVEVYANYGHGGAGWQGSWGSAEIVRELVGGEKRGVVKGDLAKCLEVGEAKRWNSRESKL